MDRLTDKADTTHFEEITDARETKAGKAAYYFMDIIDAKTAPLLTHVSIMIAISGLFYSLAKNIYISNAILFEMIMYLVITLGCLRAIFIIRHDGNEDNAGLVPKAIDEARVRRIAYRYSLYATIVTTIAFIATLVVYQILHLLQ